MLHWKNNGDFVFSRFFPRHAQQNNGRRNLFWWRAALMSYQFRPRPFVQKLADDAKLRIGTSPRQMALHVRGGDKVHGNKYNRAETHLSPDNNALFSNLTTLARVCDFDRVFVSTRDPGIIRAMREWQRNARADSGTDVHFVWDNEEMRYGNGFHTLDLVRQSTRVCARHSHKHMLCSSKTS